MSLIIIFAFLFILGCCIGSFLNVIIWRMPRRESIIVPRSHCIRCNHYLKWYENIPLVSFALQKGICRNCGTKISNSYFLIELACSALFLASYFAAPTSFSSESELLVITSSCLLASILLALTMLDVNHFWLPDSICRLGMACGLLISFISSFTGEIELTVFLEHFFSGVIGYCALAFISNIGKIVLNKPALGKGDAKLSALIGFWLGLNGLALTLYLSFVFSGLLVIVGLLFNRIKLGNYIPFGPFLSLCCFLVWTLGNEFWANRIIAFGNLFLPN